MHNFISPVSIICGEGALSQLSQELEKYKARNVMIFADPGIIKVGLVEPVEAILREAGVSYQVYSDLEPEPPLAVGERAVQAVRQSNIDLVIGIGGGSSLDIAKAAAVLAVHEGAVQDYLNLTGTKKLTKRGIPKILIPTTSGTGAEVTDISVFSLEATKDVITHPLLLADTAIVDPRLTYTLPPRITAATGVDALTHAVEALISVNATPLTDALALDAIRRISTHLRTAVWHGSNTEARKQMSWGSLMAGLSFYNAGVSGVHALAYPLGGLYKIPHGESNAVMLPYVFDYVWPSCLDKMVLMAEALGVGRKGMTKREKALEAVKALKEIVQDVGLPQTLKEYGIKAEDLDLLAQEGIKQKRLLARSPKPYTVEDIRRIYQAAYDGEMKLGA